MQKSYLPQGGTNKFQRIKQISAEAAADGIKLWKLSIGQPAGPALLSARRAAAKAAQSAEESMHEYQDNGSPGVPGFAERFVKAHIPNANLFDSGVSYLPIPGIKPMLITIPLACGLRQNPKLLVMTHTNPGYPTPADVCGYVGAKCQALPADHTTDFLFDPDKLTFLDSDCSDENDRYPDLIKTNLPHNPSGQIATRDWLHSLCHWAAKNNVRLFNDGAYTMLDHSGSHVSLAEVASLYPGLSWAEAFSASKTIANGCGWRIGAMVGSADFIADIATIKGNIDSGFAAFAAAGALYAAEHDRESIEKHRRKYAYRLQLLDKIMVDRGMQRTIVPQAGFFSLWHTPRIAFGQAVESADHFVELMIKKTGLVMVPFHPYVRAAVTQPIEKREFQANIRVAFEEAQVGY